MKFEESKHCRSRRHCVACRDLVGGAQFRESVREVWKTDGINFDCPNGIRWDYKGGFRLGDFVAKVINVITFGLLEKRAAKKRCGCKRRQALLNSVAK